MKRKDDDDDLVHSSPPTKSRRLNNSDVDEIITMEMEMEEEQQHTHSNEERSLVLYNNNHHHPSDNNSNTPPPLLKSPTSPPFTIVIDTQFIPALKDYLLSRDTTKLEELGEDETTREPEKRSEVSKECLAVIPWVPNPMACKEIVPETCQTLEAEDSEMMDMDEAYANNNNDKLDACGVSSPWQQQQCMIPNLVQPQFRRYFW